MATFSTNPGRVPCPSMDPADRLVPPGQPKAGDSYRMVTPCDRPNGHSGPCVSTLGTITAWYNARNGGR